MSDSFEGGKSFKALNFYKILRDKGFEVIEGRNLPESNVSYKGFEKLKEKQFIDDLAYACREYLSMFIVRDKFGSDHAARRKWRHEMDKEHGEAFGLFYNKNKLRLGNLGALQGFFDALIYFLDKEDIHTVEAQLVRQFRTKLPEIPDQMAYASISDDERIALAKTADDVAGAFLTLVGQQKNISRPI
jgi:hypothetical protein